MPFSCDDIIKAFLGHEARDGDLAEDDCDGGGERVQGGGAVTFALRCPKGPGGGYVRVWGPNAHSAGPSGSYVVVERYNGVVGVRDELVPHVHGVATRRSDVNITVDPLGYGCGPAYGRYTRAIPSSAMGPGQAYPTAAALVGVIVAAFGKAGLAW